jgi:HEPN domain-containing protein
MAADPALTAETRAWLSKSANDLRQQAAEKALKGFLTWHGRPFRKTHNLEEIGEQCLVLDPTLLETVDQAAPLSEYAWRFRYPGAPEGIDAEEAGEALKAARTVHDAIVSRVPPEVRP